MLALQIKDYDYRKILFIKEKFQKINKFLFINFLSQKKLTRIPNNIQSYEINPFFVFLKHKKKNKISKIQIKARCTISNRGRSINKYNGLSRIKLREFMQFGLLSGYMKSSW